MTPLPNLATERAISPDGLRYRFALRRVVTWHDGQPFTAADVAFSLLRLREAHPARAHHLRQRRRGAHARSHSVEIVLSRPAPFLISAFAGAESPIVPRHVYEAIRPRRARASPDHRHRAVHAQGVGAGSHLLFERNPNYWDEGKPYLDRIVMRIITDPGARAAAFEAGEVDLGGNPVPARGPRPPARPAEARGRHHDLRLFRAPDPALLHLDTGVLQDLRVRRRWRTPSTSRHCWRRCISGTARSRRPRQRRASEVSRREPRAGAIRREAGRGSARRGRPPPRARRYPLPAPAHPQPVPGGAPTATSSARR